MKGHKNSQNSKFLLFLLDYGRIRILTNNDGSDPEDPKTYGFGSTTLASCLQKFSGFFSLVMPPEPPVKESTTYTTVFCSVVDPQWFQCGS
jgi:hypothetical protein